MNEITNVEGFAAEQTGKREWRARVWHAGKWHAIGCRDSQADALKAAREVWHSRRGDWSGVGKETRRTFRERYNTDFEPEAFATDGEEEIIRGTHGDMRERDDWLLVRFRGCCSAELRTIEARLERDWYGSKKRQDGHLFAVGIGRPFSVAMGALIRAPMKKPAQLTEGLPKVPAGALENKGLHADKTETRYPSMGQTAVRVKPNNGAGFACEHCGAEMYRVRRGHFCSDRCRKAASRVAA